MKNLSRVLKVMENQINSETFKLNALRQKIIENEKLKEKYTTELAFLSSFKVLDVNQLRFLNEYQNFIRKKLSDIDLILEKLQEEEKRIVEFIKEKNAEKKAIESYIRKTLLNQEVKKQFEDAIENSNIYNRSFSNSIV